MKASDFLQQPHPTKALFRKHRIPFAAVANYMGLSTAYTCSLLSGSARITPAHEEQLQTFANMVRKEYEK